MTSELLPWQLRDIKCPECGDGEKQQRLGPVGEAPGHIVYRCARCAKLYTITFLELAELVDQLQSLKAEVQLLAARQTDFNGRIAEMEAHIKVAHG